MSNEPDVSDRRRKVRILAALAALPGVIALLAWLSMPGKAPIPQADAAEAVEEAPAVEEPAAETTGVHVVVHKSKHELTLYREGHEPKTYKVALGGEPAGDKERRGDCRTPLGTFYVCQKNQKSKYYLFIAISYPNEEDAKRGLKDGLISQAQHDAIVEAVANHKTPPWETKLGGEIGLHGGGSAWDWTSGCIGLDNGDMRELYAAVPMGAAVTIEP